MEIAEAAAFYSVSIATVQLWLKRGEFRGEDPPINDPVAFQRWWLKHNSQRVPAGIRRRAIEAEGGEGFSGPTDAEIEAMGDFAAVMEASRAHYAYVAAQIKAARDANSTDLVLALSKEFREAERNLRDTEKAAVKVCLAQRTHLPVGDVIAAVGDGEAAARRAVKEVLLRRLKAEAVLPAVRVREIVEAVMAEAAEAAREALAEIMGGGSGNAQ